MVISRSDGTVQQVHKCFMLYMFSKQLSVSKVYLPDNVMLQMVKVNVNVLRLCCVYRHFYKCEGLLYFGLKKNMYSLHQ